MAREIFNLDWILGPKSLYEVDIFLDGKHPYLADNSLDYESRNVVVTVSARSFDKAVDEAYSVSSTFGRWWSYHVIGVRRISKHDEYNGLYRKYIDH